VLLGTGGGLCLNAGLTFVHTLAAPEHRGACNGAFYTCAYIGFGMPLLTTAFVEVDALVTPLSLLAATAALTSVWLLRQSAEIPAPPNPL
jgi:hypothetical protein